MEGEPQRHVGLFGGSFNPVHTGHVSLAKEIMERTGLDEVWFVVSPLNPLKVNPEELVNENARLEMVTLAVENIPRIGVCDIELKLPKPSYTVDTLRELKRLYPDTSFSLIIGADSYCSFSKWKEPDEILNLTGEILVYPREGYPVPDNLPAGFRFVKSRLYPVSSTEVRTMLAGGKVCEARLGNLVPEKVLEYIEKNKLYRDGRS